MIKKLQYILLSVALLILCYNCIEEIELQSETFESALVIEATITNEIKQQEILLSRTFALDSTGSAPERNANVKVVDDIQNKYTFLETDPGTYMSTSAFSVQPNRSYTLQVITNDVKSYVSHATQLTQTTQIDDLYVKRGFNENNEEGMLIFIDTFDPTGNSRFYRYTYEETYKIIVPAYSPFEIVFQEGSFFEHDILLRPEQEQICYNTVNSNNIIIANTSNFVEDRIDGFRVRFINRDNFILSHRYSALVKQHVQSREAYTFYQTLKEFSESESLFSQIQPGLISGNVFSLSNSSEKVLGFFDIASVSEKRIFFNYVDFFPDEDLPPYYISCRRRFTAPVVMTQGGGHPLFDAIDNGFQYFFLNSNSDEDNVFGEGPYALVARECGDCTALGKTEIPDFWVD